MSKVRLSLLIIWMIINFPREEKDHSFLRWYQCTVEKKKKKSLGIKWEQNRRNSYEYEIIITYTSNLFSVLKIQTINVNIEIK